MKDVSACGGGQPAALRQISDSQREMARHALGLPNKKRTSYRNHYCIGPGGDGYEDWDDLAAKGLAIRRTGPDWGGDDMFYLTLNAALAVREPGEHISREDAQQMRSREDAVLSGARRAGGAPPQAKHETKTEENS